MILLSSIIETFETQLLTQYHDSILPSHIKALGAHAELSHHLHPLMLTEYTESSYSIRAGIATVLTTNTMKVNNGWNANSKRECLPSVSY
uniref:Uncharacterized protein n=1 Tax=Candidatus Kentrum sp. TC TaxID=2126339 RepID=A0A450YWX8_9GAMM|nr:MAG: hypothetical protein BECKTC1821E_GA0114239_105711 [Candidatus Kentron sp. TC]